MDDLNVPRHLSPALRQHLEDRGLLRDGNLFDRRSKILTSDRCLSPLVLPLFGAHGGDIEAVLQQVRPEQTVLVLDRVLAKLNVSGYFIISDPIALRFTHLTDMGKEPDNAGAEDAQTAGEIEWVLSTRSSCFPAAIGDNVRKDVIADESANLAESCSNGVILATNTSAARLRRNKADVISRSDLSERQEDTVDDDKAANVRGLLEVTVGAAHDEANDALCGHKYAQSESWTQLVTNRSANLLPLAHSRSRRHNRYSRGLLAHKTS